MRKDVKDAHFCWICLSQSQFFCVIHYSKLNTILYFHQVIHFFVGFLPAQFFYQVVALIHRFFFPIHCSSLIAIIIIHAKKVGKLKERKTKKMNYVTR